MVELTQDMIKEIVSEIIQVSNNSTDTSWIPVAGVAISVGVLAFSIFQFTRTQKQHNISQEETQKQFNKIQEKTQNLEFIKQIEYYDDELTKIGRMTDYIGYPGCLNHAKEHLTLLNRIAYLKTKNLVNDDFMQFFENDFNEGRSFLRWLEVTKFGPITYDKMYLHFRQIKDTIDYSNPRVSLVPKYYYYARQFTDNPNYDPKDDDTDPIPYVITNTDVPLFDPNLKHPKTS